MAQLHLASLTRRGTSARNHSCISGIVQGIEIFAENSAGRAYGPVVYAAADCLAIKSP